MYDIFYTSTSRHDIKASTLATALNPSDPTYHRNARRQVGTSCHLCVDFRLWPKIGHGKHLGSTGINQFNPLPDPPAFHGEGKGWLSQVGFGLKILGKAVYSKFWKSKVQSLCKSKKTSLNRKNIYKSHAQLIDIFGELCVAIWLAGLLWKVLSWKLTSVQDTLQLTYNSTSQYLKYEWYRNFEVPT